MLAELFPELSKAVESAATSGDVVSLLTAWVLHRLLCARRWPWSKHPNPTHSFPPGGHSAWKAMHGSWSSPSCMVTTREPTPPRRLPRHSHNMT